MNLKDGLELNYWRQADLETHAAKLPLYLWAWGCFRMPKRILEIGCGPLGGFLPMFPEAERRLGVDPLAADYALMDNPRMFPEIGSGLSYAAVNFETFESAERFDTIFCADALDHGDMGFHLLPRIHDLLEPRGRLYLHVNLRPTELLNESHDHSLTMEDYYKHKPPGAWFTLHEYIVPEDIDGRFACPTLLAVLERR